MPLELVNFLSNNNNNNNLGVNLLVMYVLLPDHVLSLSYLSLLSPSHLSIHQSGVC